MGQPSMDEILWHRRETRRKQRKQTSSCSSEAPRLLDNRMVFFGEKFLRKALSEFTAHYHAERNHQGLGNKIIEPGSEVGRTKGEVRRGKRRTKLLKVAPRKRHLSFSMLRIGRECEPV